MESSVIPTSQLPTGDTAVGNPQRFSFIAPSDLWIIQTLMGLISQYCDVGSWYQVGTATPDDAAAIFSQMFTTFGVDMATTGVIVPFGGGILPTGWLPCDGASYLRADYANLFAAIGTVWGAADSTHFNVPDLRGKTLVGQGTNPGTGTTFNLGTYAGEEAHAQTLSELATHAHTDAGHVHTTGNSVTIVAVVPGDGPVLAPNPIPAFTGSGNASIQNSGSGTPANVMQPYGVVNFAIIS